MRVCFISHTADKYGAEFALLELLQGLIAEGVDCMVLVPKKGILLGELDRLRIPWKVIGYPRWIVGTRGKWVLGRVTRTIKGLLLAIPMAWTITRWRCDLVYSNTVAIGAGAFAAWLARRPHVWHLHEFAYRDPNLLFDFGERWTMRLMNHFSAAFIANSHAVVKDYDPYINQQRMYMIYQAVTLRDCDENRQNRSTILIKNKSNFTCVMVGSLHVAKGQDEAIHALSELVHRGIDAKLLLVGNGSRRYRELLAKQIKFSCLEERVKFIGYAENPLKYIEIADLILVCSRWETFGRVVVEAMLGEKPVIATANSGGPAELIQNGKTGLLYEGGNYNELADKIQFLYENPEERLTLSKAARAWATGRFTQERYAKEVITVLNKVLNEDTT